MSKVIIVGGGPAGVSAALYTVRAGLDTTIISSGVGALGKAHAIENYYGFALPVSGEALAMSGLEQARRLGVKIVEDEVTSIGFMDKLTVKTTSDEFDADYVLLSTGSPRTAPRISGLSENEGKGVSYCAVCDAFFHKGKPVAVLGEGEYALHEVKELLPVATAFSGGMGSGCLCGAIAGSQMILGYLFGRDNKQGNDMKARAAAKGFVDEFLKSHKATCCRVLTRGLEMASPERKAHCSNMIDDCTKILDDMIKVKV